MTIRRIIFAMILIAIVVDGNAGVFDGKEKCSLELESTPLVSVLNGIAQQYELNIVIADDVRGEVTLRLLDVDLETALNAILAPNGYNYYIKDNVIMVKSSSSIGVGEFVSRVITLKYVEPVTALKALETVKSEKGHVVILDKSTEGSTTENTYQANRILITDSPELVNQMMQLIVNLDKPERLISIEVKIIETKVDTKSKLGIAWPTAVNASLGAGTKSVSESSSSGTSSESSESTLQNIAATMDVETGQWIWGTLSVAQLDAVLDLLEQNDNSKLISDPRITTVENHEAEIKIQTVIPIPTINRFSEASTTTDILTFQDEEVGISLKVTPRINEGNRITMDVMPIIEDIIGFAGPIDNQKPITTERSIKTQVTVNDGETAVLGGLLKEDEIIIERKFPLLGHIPIIGRLLFTNKSVEKTTTDLMILITPHIMQ